MESVFVVQHLHVLPNEEEDIKFIGVYRTRGIAQAAIERLRGQSGFCDHPNVVDTINGTEWSGFYIEEYRLDFDHWTEGYVTL